MADVSTRNEWSTEEAYWRDNYQRRPYVESGRAYDFYRPAYRFGYESADRYRAGKWDDVENDLRGEWDTYEYRGESTWAQIKHAVRDAWERVTGNR
jgi:hypothetical protein